jgi:hypothetical protein
MIKTVATFRLLGDLIDFAEFEALTGLTATETLPRAGRLPSRPIMWNAWHLASAAELSGYGDRPPGDIRQPLDWLADRLEAPADLIRRYDAAHGLTTVIEVWIESSDGTLPRLVVTPRCADLAARLEADVDFSLYPWMGQEWAEELPARLGIPIYE